MTSTHFNTIIDANCNRAREGARVLEDIARFLLNDEDLFQRIREVRHAIRPFVLERFPHDDPGGAAFVEDAVRTDLLDVVTANALRLQEALRVLEEVAPDREKYKRLRFAAYALHQEIHNKSKKFLNKMSLSGIYVLYDPDKIKISIEKVLDVINSAQVNLFQLRTKHLTKREILRLAQKIKSNLCKETKLIINDHLDVALACADGVHLGLGDFPVDEARVLAPPGFLIGTSTHNLEEALKAEKEGADYISVGCLFPTHSKTDTTPTSLQTLKQIRGGIKIPICAVGGIKGDNIASVVAQGVEMVAVMSAVWSAGDPREAILSLIPPTPSAQ